MGSFVTPAPCASPFTADIRWSVQEEAPKSELTAKSEASRSDSTSGLREEIPNPGLPNDDWLGAPSLLLSLCETLVDDTEKKVKPASKVHHPYSGPTRVGVVEIFVTDAYVGVKDTLTSETIDANSDTDNHHMDLAQSTRVLDTLCIPRDLSVELEPEYIRISTTATPQ
jgi:hypothetical protein